MDRRRGRICAAVAAAVIALASGCGGGGSDEQLTEGDAVLAARQHLGMGDGLDAEVTIDRGDRVCALAVFSNGDSVILVGDDGDWVAVHDGDDLASTYDPTATRCVREG
jgi:hypothetical protein